MSQVDDAEITEALRKVPPGDAGSVAVEQRFDKQPIVFGGDIDMAGATGK